MKTILITGASSGIGEALALHYSADGHRLVLGGRDGGRLEAVAEACRKAGAEVHFQVGDVRARDLMHQWICGSDKRFTLDLVIANAGISGGTGGAVLCRQGNGGSDVQHEGPEDPESCQPDAPPVNKVMKKLGIFIEILASLKNEEVPRHVTQKEADEHDARDSDNQLSPNGGSPKSAECFAKRVHLRFLNHYDGYLQEDGFEKSEKCRHFHN